MPSLVELLKRGQNTSFKSLIDRMLDKPAFDNSEYNKLGLNGPPTKVGDIASMAIDAMPGIGDISAALKVPDNLRNKEYGQAALNSLGALPMVAGVGAIRDPAKSSVRLYDDIAGTLEEEEASDLALEALKRVINKQSKVFGTTKDPVYRAINAGIINEDNFFDLIPSAIQEGPDVDYVRERLVDTAIQLGVPKHIAESEYMTPEALTDFIRQEQGTELQTNNPRLEDIYDYTLLSGAHTKDRLINGIGGIGNEIYEFPGLDNKFFRNAPNNHLVFDAVIPNDLAETLPSKAIDYALKEKWITPQSIKDGKIGIPEMIKLSDRYEKAILSSKIRNTFEPKYEFDDGHKWVELKDPDALTAEGKLMNNCVGGYCKSVADGEARIFSLRSPTNKSILNVEVDPATREIIQAHSNSNGPIKPDQKSYMDAFEALYHNW